MKVKDYMQTEPITVAPEELVTMAYERMHERRIRHLPVVTDEGNLVGIVTDRDIRRAGASDEPHMAEYDLGYLLEKMKVKDVMTQAVVTVRAETPLTEACQVLIEKKFGCLPVLADNDVLAGIITVADVLRAYVNQHQEAQD